MEELQRYWLILRRRRIPALIVFVLVLTGSVVSTVTMKPIYESRGQMLLKSNQGADVSSRVSLRDAIGSGPTRLNTAIQLIRTYAIAQETQKRLKLTDTQPEAIIGGLRIINLQDTDILQLSYRSSNPQQASAIINTLMQVYGESDLARSRSETQATREFIEKQLPLTEATAQAAEQKLRDFKETNKILDMNSEIASVRGNLNDLEARINAVKSDLADASRRTTELASLVSLNTRTALNTSNPQVQDLLGQLQKIEERLTLEETRFNDSSPIIQDLKEKQAALKSLLQQRLGQSVTDFTNTAKLQISGSQRSIISDYAAAKANKLSLTNRLAALTAVQNTYKERASTLPRLEQTEKELQRQVRAAQSTYELLLNRLQEVRVAENQTIGSVQIITSASTPTFPILPKYSESIPRGVLLSIALAVITALVLDAVDRTIKTSDEIKLLSGHALLAIIPRFKPANAFLKRIQQGNLLEGEEPTQLLPLPEADLIVVKQPFAPASEAFQMLQTNMRFLSLDKHLKVVLITSSVPGEGKSTVSANLAVSVAQTGRKVLLIDSDMRNPSIHRLCGLPNLRGLSDVMIGRVEFAEAVQTLEPGITVLTAGSFPPNPVTILDSQRMTTFIETVSQDYDLVILDSPPIRVAADAMVLGKLADGIIFVARLGTVDSNSLKYSVQLLEQAGRNIVGFVVNDVPSESDSYNYYYYQGNYRYGSRKAEA